MFSRRCCELLLARKLRHLRHRICVLAHDRPVVPNIVLCAVQYLARAQLGARGEATRDRSLVRPQATQAIRAAADKAADAATERSDR